MVGGCKTVVGSECIGAQPGGMGITSRGTQSGFEAGSAIRCTDVVGDSTRWSTVPPIEPAGYRRPAQRGRGRP